MKKVKVILGTLVLGVSVSLAQIAYYELLTTPSTTAAINAVDNVSHGFQYITTGVSTNVIVRSEGSLDGSNWFMLDDNGTPLTITSNTNKYEFKSNAPLGLVRVTWVSKSGAGTTPNIGVYYRGDKR